MLAQLAGFLQRSGLSPTYLARQRLAARYLRGAGLEIGALDHPLPVPHGVSVTYVDYQTREENLRRYPGLDPARLTAAHLLEDGFTLSSVENASQNFLIANHVLEHAANPIQVLIHWARVLKAGGIMFLSVPNGERCFDRDRSLTSIEHLQADFDAFIDGDSARRDSMDREHYREWLECSIPRIWRSEGMPVPELTGAEKESRIETMFSAREEIHYHVFSRKSLIDLFERVTNRYCADLKLEQISTAITGAEFVLIARKLETEL